MNTQEIDQKAEFLRQQLGGLIVAFPTDEADPYSKFAVVVYTGDGFRAFPKPLDVSEAAAGIASMVEGLDENGHRVDFDREVRFLVGATQFNGPNVLMRRLREDSRNYDSRRMEDLGSETAFTPRGFVNPPPLKWEASIHRHGRSFGTRQRGCHPSFPDPLGWTGSWIPGHLPGTSSRRRPLPFGSCRLSQYYS
ncbi:hypothetical protein [Kyrpidia tusciae]|uniref:Uncharacterized protein n=1 Tax=Kyrpidia tusciae (strain DSM 2912 / NBRC 15312 / T2) TaxID=562970 RepID=D5WQY5_KYRT2|nr:hypothetical protein [Kyrpidia tusciae]ADG06744.1 hypothetical protein Btus_2054 [Kyrpidia tusciae DSM 2912]